MRNSAFRKRTSTAFLLSLILHILIGIVLTIVLLEPYHEETAESLMVDIVMAAKRVMPLRRTERLEAWRSIPDSRNPSRQRAKMQSELRRHEEAQVSFDEQPRLSEELDVITDLTTSADRLRARPDMPLPRVMGADITKPGSGNGRSSSGISGAGSVGLSPEAGIFEKALYWIARNTVGKNKTGREDIIFLIDSSGTMADNIEAVARYIGKMIEVFGESDLDYTMGVVRFKYVIRDDGTKVNDIKVYDQTEDADEVMAILRSINCRDDERTLDAIEVALTKVDFRDPVDKTFILVTDESFGPRNATRRNRKDLTFREMLQMDYREVLKACQDNSVKVSVLGIDDEMHKSMAKKTGGLWFQIPQQEGFP